MKPPFVEESPLAFGGYRPEGHALYRILGAPFDSTSSYRSGQRWGPRAIREASAYIEFTSLHAGMQVDYVPMYDEGDVMVVHGDVIETLRRISQAVANIAASGGIPVLLGGEHTVTYGAVEGVTSALGEPPCLLVFDAHFDLREEYLGYRYSHACVMKRIIERIHPPMMAYVGIRGFSDEEVELASKRSNIVYATSLDVEALGEANIAARLKKSLAPCRRIYLSIDMDFLDPAYAPGVGNPEPGGLTFREALNLIHNLVDERVIGIDIVEVVPPYDPSGLTAVVAAKLTVETIAALEKSRRS